MNATNFIISAVAAVSVVGAISLAYAQTAAPSTTTTPTVTVTTPAATVQTPPTDPAMGASSTNPMNTNRNLDGTTGERVARADRN
jgi:hypothetical protein